LDINLVGLVTLLLIQTGERNAALKRGLMKGPLRTWIACAAIFTAGLYALIPGFRLGLLLPCILCAGLITPWVYGPIQDAIVRRIQRKARGFTDPGTRAKS
jgi:hypothetical protein